MGGPADLPEGFDLDAGDTSTLADIFAAAGAPMPLTSHEVFREHMQGAIRGNRPIGLSFLELDDPIATVEAWVGSLAGRRLGYSPTWIRIVRPDLDHGALFLIDNLHVNGEAELTVVAEPGVITRSVIRDVCRWAFRGLRLNRVVARIPDNCPDLSSLAGRAGFQREGTARGFYGGIVDAEIWAMTAADCPWLPPLPAIPSMGEIIVPANAKVH
ncbi:GNAT family N-acetyltransferase [Methylobacterium sp. J-088]|uniref:GNAT family N-acetyltransferase n=1 Tax=Methylobacterium sp. J-088 TaxID=2836664 RepID=UPI001FBB24CF|nr:GNAT family protein [Methylobacterium sp. J-088]MCJ2063242.1 GNAT family N-acetyltransferase [Methylobacterium sp. J-088]